MTTNGEHGVEHQRVMVLELTYNCATFQVTIGGMPMPLSLAQMIAGEGLRLLEEQRRLAAAQQLRQVLAQQAQDAAIVQTLGHRR